MDCAVCGNELPTAAGAGRPRRYCSPVCRQRAYRGRRRTTDHAGCGVPPGAGPPFVAVLLVPAWPGLDEAIEAVSGFDWTALIVGLSNGFESQEPQKPGEPDSRLTPRAQHESDE